MIKLLIIALLVCLTLSRQYVMYKQCDPQWANDRMGTSSDTICSSGCLISSVAMATFSCGCIYNQPASLNHWLGINGGYVNGDNFIWGSITPFKFIFQGKVANWQIKSKIDQGRVVILNVRNGGHWVLAKGYSGDNIFVNDPGFPVNSYSLSQIVDGQTAIYRVTQGPCYSAVESDSAHNLHIQQINKMQ